MLEPKVKCTVQREVPLPPPPTITLEMDGDTASILRDLIGKTCGNSLHIMELYRALDTHLRIAAYVPQVQYNIGGRFTAGDPASVGVWIAKKL